jgi:ketosteroid isomerase-like protein
MQNADMVRAMFVMEASMIVLLACTPAAVVAQTSPYAADVAQIMQADADFARSVAERNQERFRSFLADTATFNGGTANELRGREAVATAWADFFDPKGPVLSWTPSHGEVIGAGDVGFTVGRSTLRVRAADGAVTERPGEYLTVWRKQRDGSWKVVFDTGSTLPPPR